MNYLEYSQEVSTCMAMLQAKGFTTNHWTRECSGNLNGQQMFVTFYPDDERYILIMKEGKEGKYISKAELIAILNSNN